MGYAIRLEGPEDPQLRNAWFRRSRDPALASIPLAQTPWGLTGRAWLQAGAQRGVIVVFLPLNSLGIDSRNAVRDHDNICMQLVPDYSAQTVKHLWKGWKQSS